MMSPITSASTLLCLGGLLLVTGCATPVQTDYKVGVDFSKYRTFALLPLPQRGPAEDPGAAVRLAQPARDTVVSEMTAKGLKETSADDADLTINLRGQSLPRVEIRDHGYTYPVFTRYGTVTVIENPYTTVSTYQERTLIVEICDRSAHEMVWVGSTKKNTSGPVTPDGLQEAIRQVLAKFPPAPESKKS